MVSPERKWRHNPSGDPFDEDLYNAIIHDTGLKLLSRLELIARGWITGSALALLGKAGCVAACDSPSVSVFTGFGSRPAPLNLFVGFVGKPGQGKGLSMGVKMNYARSTASNTTLVRPPNTGVELGESSGLTFTPPKPQGYASGEVLVSAFWETEETEDGKKILKRHYRPVWADYPEVDSLVAKASMGKGANKNNNVTLESVLRSSWTGEAVGDRSIGRDKDKIGSTLDEMSYRCVTTVGVQPSKGAPLVNDDGGGTAQRLDLFGVEDPLAPAPDDFNRPEDYVRAVEAFRAKLFADLRISPTDLPPMLDVPGPGEITVDAEVRTHVIVHRGYVNTGTGDIEDIATHQVNRQARWAAIHAGWREYEQRGFLLPTTELTMVDWEWAAAVMEHGERMRHVIVTAAKTAEANDRANIGVGYALSKVAQEDELDRIATRRFEADKQVALGKIGQNPGISRRDLDRKSSGNKKKTLPDVLTALEDEQRIVVLRSGNSRGDRFWQVDHKGNPIDPDGAYPTVDPSEDDTVAPQPNTFTPRVVS